MKIYYKFMIIYIYIKIIIEKYDLFKFQYKIAFLIRFLFDIKYHLCIYQQ